MTPARVGMEAWSIANRRAGRFLEGTRAGSPSYVEAPTPYDGAEPALFLAGGITDCPN
jgi:hypothetical protein